MVSMSPCFKRPNVVITGDLVLGSDQKFEMVGVVDIAQTVPKYPAFCLSSTESDELSSLPSRAWNNLSIDSSCVCSSALSSSTKYWVSSCTLVGICRVAPRMLMSCVAFSKNPKQAGLLRIGKIRMFPNFTLSKFSIISFACNHVFCGPIPKFGSELRPRKPFADSLDLVGFA